MRIIETSITAVVLLLALQVFGCSAYSQEVVPDNLLPEAEMENTAEPEPAPPAKSDIEEEMMREESPPEAKEKKREYLFESDPLAEAVDKVFPVFIGKIIEPVPERYKGLLNDPETMQLYKKRLVEELSGKQGDTSEFDQLSPAEKVSAITRKAEELLPEIYSHDRFFKPYTKTILGWIFPGREDLIEVAPGELTDILERSLSNKTKKQFEGYKDRDLAVFFQMLDEMGLMSVDMEVMKEELPMEKIFDLSLEWYYNYMFSNIPEDVRQKADWKAIKNEHKQLLNLSGSEENTGDGTIITVIQNLFLDFDGALSDRLIHSFVRYY